VPPAWNQPGLHDEGACWIGFSAAHVFSLGEAFFGGTTWLGKRCMRISVCSCQTCAADVDSAVRAAQRVLGNVSP
jgi:hypothetical protein